MIKHRVSSRRPVVDPDMTMTPGGLVRRPSAGRDVLPVRIGLVAWRAGERSRLRLLEQYVLLSNCYCAYCLWNLPAISAAYGQAFALNSFRPPSGTIRATQYRPPESSRCTANRKPRPQRQLAQQRVKIRYSFCFRCHGSVVGVKCLLGTKHTCWLHAYWNRAPEILTPGPFAAPDEAAVRRILAEPSAYAQRPATAGVAHRAVGG